MPEPMPDRQAALAEAYKRGILPAEVSIAYEEAQKRGLVESPGSQTKIFGMTIPTGAEGRASIDARQQRDAEIKARQRELNKGNNPFGPAGRDRAESRDLHLELEGKTRTGPEAMMVRGINGFALGIPSAVNEDFRAEIATAGAERPGWALAGDVAGFGAGGGKIIASAGAKVLPKAFVPKMVGLGALGAGENAVYEATVGESNRQAAGQSDGTVNERLGAGADGARNPFAWAAGPVVGGAIEGGARLFRGAESSSQLSSVLNGVLDDGAVSPDGLKGLERFLRNEGVTLDSVSIDRINSAVNSVLESGADAAALPVRLKDILIEALDGPSGQLGNAVQKQLRGTVVAGGDGAKTITNAIDQDLPASREYLQGGLQDNLGSQSRLSASDDIGERLSEIGREGYAPLLQAGPTTQEGAAALLEVLNGPGMLKAGNGSSTLLQPLKTMAAGEGIDLNRFIAERPLEAAHWMQSKARKLADSADPTIRSAFTSLRKRLLVGINKASPGYDDVRRAYGDEFGNEQALAFGDKFLTKAGQDLDIDIMAREFAELSPSQQEAALLSVRDALQSSTGRGRAVNGPRLTRVTEEQVMTALPKVFGEAGDRVAATIQKTDDFVQSRLRVDSRRGSPTATNQEAAQYAKDTVMPPWRQKLGQAIENAASDTGVSAAFGHFVPFRTLRATSGAIGRKISGNPDGKMNDLASLLEAPVSPNRAPTPSPNALAAPAGGVSAPAAQSQNALAAPAQGAAPANVPAEQPVKNGLGDNALDALAVASIASSVTPQADAQTGGDYSGELDAAKSRVSMFETETIPNLEANLRALEDPDTDPKEKQRVLQLMGYDLGPTGIDGVIGPVTMRAINAKSDEIRGDLRIARDELDKARASATELEQRAIYADSDKGSDILREAAPWGGLLAGLAIAGRRRGGAVKKSQQVARGIEDKANTLLDPSAVTRGIATERGMNTRAANINEFWRMGGAGENVPFKTLRNGEWRPKPRAADPSSLFAQKAPLYGGSDLGVMGLGAAEGGASTLGVVQTEAKIEKLEADVEKFAAAGDSAGLERALADLEAQRNWLAMWQAGQRMGAMMVAGGALKPLSKPYATARPNVNVAEKESALLLAAMNKSKNAGK